MRIEARVAEMDIDFEEKMDAFIKRSRETDRAIRCQDTEHPTHLAENMIGSIYSIIVSKPCSVLRG